MKKIILLTIAIIAALGVSTAFAGNGPSIHSIITKQIKVPAQLKDKKLNEKVNVEFKIGQNGVPAVLDVKTSNPELKKYVLNQFKTLDFSNVTDKQEVTYFIDLNFKVL